MDVRFRFRWFMMAIVSATATLSTLSLEAARLPDHLRGQPELEIYAGAPVRNYRERLFQSVPPSARRAWVKLVGEMGPNTLATWDRATGVPSRIFGSFIEVPASVGSARVARRFTEKFLERHIALLAPGSRPADFVLVSNDLDAGIRSLGFYQMHRGLRVIGGQLSFRFKNDRLFVIGSEALPHVRTSTGGHLASPVVLRKHAERWVAAEARETTVTPEVEAAAILPLVSRRKTQFRVVRRVTVDAQEPLGRWWVYLDAYSAEPVARRQTLQFASATVKLNAPERRPGAMRVDYEAPLMHVNVAGQTETTDSSGLLSWPGTEAASGTITLDGELVTVENVAGSEASKQVDLQPGGTVVWNAASSEYKDAQLNVYVHANRVKAYARSFSELPWLDEKLEAYANINKSCNAYYDGDINFYRENNNCNNTGRLADVVAHELGHGLHRHSIIKGVGDFDGALSEGLSDYLAVTISGDPGMGRGWFKSNSALRHLDPSDKEHIWPDDIKGIHWTGRIIGGALWDLREMLIDDLGEEEGVSTANHIYYQAMRRAVDIPTMYIEALVADDDDGDLANGTPHACAINLAFGMHGLRTISAQSTTEAVQPPDVDELEVRVGFIGISGQCPGDDIASAKVVWHMRDDESVGGSVAMNFTDEALVAQLPVQADGTVLNYRVDVSFGDGATKSYPDNLADPIYEMFIGHVEPIYCTDFETDPFEEGWTHDLLSGEPSKGADDWQWGEPVAPTSSGDPMSAYSGEHVIGNDLGPDDFNGEYQPNKVNQVKSPIIDTQAYEVVRLQYRRWLTVEDGYFDRATIYVDDEAHWSNLNSEQGDDSNVHHRDKEWRFHDVDVSDAAADGELVVRYELSSDQGLHLGGWTVDNFCVVGWAPTQCGDGVITGEESCDDGEANSDEEADACRNDCTQAGCGDGVVDSGESCDDGNEFDDDHCTNDCQTNDVASPEDPASIGAPSREGGACGCRVQDRRDPGMGWLWMALAAIAYRRRLQTGRRSRG